MHGGAVERREVAALEADRPAARDEPQQRAAERRLAGAGFADDADRLAGPHREIDAVDGADRAAPPARRGRRERDVAAHVRLEHDGRAGRGRRLRPARLGLDQRLV